MPLAPGDVFAGYPVVRQLGAGGMGEVHLVRHPRLPRLEALKVLRPEYSADADFARRFLLEADLVAGLEHRNIVPVLDRGEDEGRLWLTMRYVDGIDAEDALAAAGGLLPARRAVHIVTEVAAALDCAHRSNLVHRDVKPANVLLSRPVDDEPEQVFLTDFGIASALDAATRLTRTGMVLATFDYASPEQFESLPLDARSDVYSLGCVLHRLLTGSVPFPGRLGRGGAARPPGPAAARGRRRGHPGCRPGLDAVIARAMAKDPGDRYPTCRALAADAPAALDSLPPVPALPFRVAVAEAGGSTSPGQRRALPAERRRLTRAAPADPVLRPAALAGGRHGGDGARRRRPGRQVTLEVTSGGRTHRVVADLGSAHRPPELDDLVDTVRELASAVPAAPPTRVSQPSTVLELPRQGPPPPVPPGTGARRAETAPPSRAVLPAHPPPPPAAGPRTPPPWLHQPDAAPAAGRPPTQPPAPGAAPARGRRRGPVLALVVAVLVAAGGTTYLLTRPDDDGTGAEAGAVRPDSADAGRPGGCPGGAARSRGAARQRGRAQPARSTERPTSTRSTADSGDVVARLTELPGRRRRPRPRARPRLRRLRAGRRRRRRVAGGRRRRQRRPAAVPGRGRPTATRPRPARRSTPPTRAGWRWSATRRRGPVPAAAHARRRAVDVLHESEAVLGDPAFSPDGTRVVFFAGNDPERDGGSLYLVEVDEPRRRRPPHRERRRGGRRPSWSPDGRQLAWRREIAGGQRSIVVGSPDEVDDARILTAGSFDQDPSWSPDGATIAFKSNGAGDAAPGGDQLWLVDADGSDPRQVPADEGAVVNALAWADYG